MQKAMSPVIDDYYENISNELVGLVVFYSENYVKSNEVRDFEFINKKILNKISNRFSKYIADMLALLHTSSK